MKTILSTGSPLVPESFDYVYEHVKENVQLSSISGGTDLMGCFALGNPTGAVWRQVLMFVERFSHVDLPRPNRHKSSDGKRFGLKRHMLLEPPFPNFSSPLVVFERDWPSLVGGESNPARPGRNQGRKPPMKHRFSRIQDA